MQTICQLWSNRVDRLGFLNGVVQMPIHMLWALSTNASQRKPQKQRLSDSIQQGSWGSPMIHLRKQCHWKYIHVVGREWIFFDYTYMSPSPNVRYSFSHYQCRSYIVRTYTFAITHPSCFRWSACFCAGTESDSLAKPRHYLLWKESRMGRDVMSGADLPRKKLGDSHRTFGLGCPTRCQITQVMAILWYVLKARTQWTTMDLSLSGIDQRYRRAEGKMW